MVVHQRRYSYHFAVARRFEPGLAGVALGAPPHAAGEHPVSVTGVIRIAVVYSQLFPIIIFDECYCNKQIN